MRFVALALAIAWLTGCASTEIVGYSDPAYQSASYTETVVHAQNVGLAKAADLEGDICQELSAKGINCRPFQSLFPPTRGHSADSVFQALQKQGIGSLIILSPSGDYSSSSTFGYQSFGSANAVGGQVSASSSTVPMTAFSRQSHMRILVVDAKAREVAWMGDAKTEGQGLANTTDSAFMSSLSKSVAQELSATPHFSGGD
ncbi:hypothetical protein O4H29_06755 [Marinobacter salarius]|uniref:hypothetical protein n=1 Tax=Marinobacter salarius TaxID=1420917 RepID=UPI0022B0B5B8|nr:hypothetical protein [Marinobacter salarius]MCZ4284532.1 hypothetical protein [Marinobacter salarius]